MTIKTLKKIRNIFLLLAIAGAVGIWTLDTTSGEQLILTIGTILSVIVSCVFISIILKMKDEEWETSRTSIYKDEEQSDLIKLQEDNKK